MATPSGFVIGVLLVGRTQSAPVATVRHPFLSGFSCLYTLFFLFLKWGRLLCHFASFSSCIFVTKMFWKNSRPPRKTSVLLEIHASCREFTRSTQDYTRSTQERSRPAQDYSRPPGKIREARRDDREVSRRGIPSGLSPFSSHGPRAAIIGGTRRVEVCINVEFVLSRQVPADLLKA